MQLISSLALFFSGVLLVLISAKLLIEVSKELAIKIKLSPLFVSLILVALGTNLPEFTVMISALLKADAGLALGNVVGSNISNLTLILGTGILFHPPRVGTSKTIKNTLIMLFITLLFVILTLSPLKEIYQGLILLICLFAFVIYEYTLALYGRTHEDKKMINQLQKLSKTKKFKFKFFKQKGVIWLPILAILGSILGLALGSQIVVQSIRQLSIILNLSTTLLGMTLVATTTSLPELITILVAGAEKEDKIMLGTLIGSNIYNLSFFVPIILMSPFKANLRASDVIYLNISVMLFALIIFANKGKNIKKFWGLLSIILFIVFIVHSFIS